jgi:hypothetical protein
MLWWAVGVSWVPIFVVAPLSPLVHRQHEGRQFGVGQVAAVALGVGKPLYRRQRPRRAGYRAGCAGIGAGTVARHRSSTCGQVGGQVDVSGAGGGKGSGMTLIKYLLGSKCKCLWCEEVATVELDEPPAATPAAAVGGPAAQGDGAALAPAALAIPGALLEVRCHPLRRHDAGGGGRGGF